MVQVHSRGFSQRFASGLLTLVLFIGIGGVVTASILMNVGVIDPIAAVGLIMFGGLGACLLFHWMP
jgi:hypothetical protein